MFVRVNQSATAEQIAAIRSRATEAGLAVYDEPTERGLTLALLGPKGFDEKLSGELVAMPGVASVARPSRAYRLSSQEFREEPTVVKVRDAVIGGGSLTSGNAVITEDVPPNALAYGRNACAGLNLIGLRRRGLPLETVAELKKAYHLVYAPGGNCTALAQAGVTSGAYLSAEAAAFLHFFLGGKRGRFIQPA